jgi:PAS domain S-box-containing protein
MTGVEPGHTVASSTIERSLIEAAPAGLCYVTSLGVVTEANTEALRILGLTGASPRPSIAEVAQRTILEDGAPCPASAHPISCALATGTSQPIQVLGIRGPQGSLVWAECRTMPMQSCEPASAGVIATFLDVTERKRAEESRRAAERKLHLLAEYNTLAATVMHEINNPLTYVMANLGRLERSAAANADRVNQGFALEALEGTRRICHIVRELGAMTRGTWEPVELGNLSDVIESSIRMVGDDLLAGISVTRDYAVPEPYPVDAVRLGHVFLNLLANAAQAIADSADPRREIHIAAQCGASGVVVAISDTGVGIRPELAARMYDPFVTTRGGAGGTGLGLYICQKIVTAMGGTIRGEPLDGGGARFVLELPG